jgi:6-phosphogluconolactonase
MTTDLHVLPDQDALTATTAGQITLLADAAIRARGQFTLGLAGGSTPRPVYAQLAREASLDWAKIHIFWGDERCVPPDHAASNYRMARAALLDHVPLPEANIHRIPGERQPEEAALAYERELRAFFVGDWPRCDLLLLGMGDDGHTASLFPGTAALTVQNRWVVENYVEKLDAWRITLTVPAINAAANVIFLVTGADKAEALHAVREGSPLPEQYPSQLVQPGQGSVVWLVDEAAAARLSR